MKNLYLNRLLPLALAFLAGAGVMFVFLPRSPQIIQSEELKETKTTLSIQWQAETKTEKQSARIITRRIQTPCVCPDSPPAILEETIKENLRETNETTMSATMKDNEALKTQSALKAAPQWQLGITGNYSFNSKGAAVGLEVNRRLFGPVFLGIRGQAGKKQTQIGAGVLVEF